MMFRLMFAWNSFLSMLDNALEKISASVESLASIMQTPLILVFHLFLWLQVFFSFPISLGLAFGLYIALQLTQALSELILLRNQLITSNRNQVKLHNILSRILVATNNAGNKRERKGK